MSKKTHLLLLTTIPVSNLNCIHAYLFGWDNFFKFLYALKCMFGSHESTPSTSSSISWPSITSAAASSIRNFLSSRKNNSLPVGKALEAPMHFPLRRDTFFSNDAFLFFRPENIQSDGNWKREKEDANNTTEVGIPPSWYHFPPRWFGIKNVVRMKNIGQKATIN